jgi:hypothetical protein
VLGCGISNLIVLFANAKKNKNFYEASLVEFMLIILFFIDENIDHICVVESLLLGSLLWFMGIMWQLSLPLLLWLTVSPPRENMEHKGLRKVTLKGPNSNISEYFLTQSFVKSRRCQASRTKMKFDFIVF